jgi:ABC-type transport system involved in multi-copper enzyme maturation permease subunit
MSLIRAERRRLFKRRFTRLMLAIVVLILAVIAVGMSLNSHRNGPAEVAAAQAQAQAEYERQVGFFNQMVSDCRAAQDRGEDITNRFPANCEFGGGGPRLESFDPQWYMPYEFNFRAEFPALIMIFAGILALFAYVVGASYVGAEWSSGGMMNLLLWRPRRIPVLLTKLGVLLGGVLSAAVVLGAAWTTVFWLIGKYDGRSAKMTPGAWESFALTGARGIGLVLVLAVVGFALASFGRHTAMALGVAVGLVVVSEIGLRIALQVMQIRMPDRFLLSTYAIAWFNKSWKLFDYRSCEFTLGECRPKELVITWQHSALLFGIGAAVTLALAIWAMRRRDVT